jgi:hypothetical protein
MIFIVVFVSMTEMHTIRTKNNNIAIEDFQDRLFEILNENIQDLHVARTVVFRGQKFSHNCIFDKEAIALVIVSYPYSFSRNRSHNLGFFQMIQEHQSNMSSRSMGVSGN